MLHKSVRDLVISGLQILPSLPTGAWQNDRNLPKYAVTGSNQSHQPMTTHFGEHRLVFGKLLHNFWSTSPKIEDFCSPPQIWPFLPTLAFIPLTY